ncbi:MAG: methylamine utilization protein [Steroidobacteraceae bacterium]|nr:methylamine utilization protein [Steroidobacteraceae bacterium]
MTNRLKALVAASCAIACGLAGAADFIIDVRDASGAPVADAAVYAELLTGTAPAPRADLRAQIDQVRKEFVPRVSVVQAGTSIHFPNSDNIRHSIYSFSPAKTFSTKLYSGREAPPVLFDRSGIVVLGCNIHDTMVAWLVIVDTPWFAKSGTDGVGTLRNLPSGNYRITATAPAANLAARSLEVAVDGAATQRRTLALAPGP